MSHPQPQQMPEGIPQYRYDHIFAPRTEAFVKLNKRAGEGWEPMGWELDTSKDVVHVLIPLRRPCESLDIWTDAIKTLDFSDDDGGNPAPAPQTDPTTPPAKDAPEPVPALHIMPCEDTVPRWQAIVPINNDPRPTPVAPTPPPPEQPQTDLITVEDDYAPQRRVRNGLPEVWNGTFWEVSVDAMHNRAVRRAFAGVQS